MHHHRHHRYFHVKEETRTNWKGKLQTYKTLTKVKLSDTLLPTDICKICHMTRAEVEVTRLQRLKQLQK